MSITDELRNHAHKYAWDGGETYDQRLIYIADRIDEELANCIELPVDADGETIHLQDRVSWDNGTFNVHELNLTADGWTTWDELHGYTVHADQCHHVKPDSWERIIADALRADRTDAYAVSTSMLCEPVERCKRLAGEE